ncbi:MAG: hypothetical protein AABW73_02675 [Nanoarchaeota archaeon]
MGTKDLVYKTEIEHDGIFDFKKLYNFAYDFLKNKSYDIAESAYSEKITPDGKEIEVKWEIEKKVTDYIKYIGKIKMTLRNLKSVEVQKGDRKENSNKGSVKVGVNSEVERDYKGDWESSWSTKFFRGIYDKFINDSVYKGFKNAYASDMDDLVGQLKSFLVLEGVK